MNPKECSLQWRQRSHMHLGQRQASAGEKETSMPSLLVCRGKSHDKGKGGEQEREITGPRRPCSTWGWRLGTAAASGVLRASSAHLSPDQRWLDR